jgi:Tol biopolymer transport system component
VVGAAAALALVAGLWLAGPSQRDAPSSAPSVPPPLPLALAAAGRAALVWHDGLWLSDEAGQFGRAGGLPRGAARDPAWRPDGRAIAVVVHAQTPATESGRPAAPASSDLWLVDPSGEARPIVRHEADGVLLERPAWHPGGGVVYFERSAYQTGAGVAAWSTRVERGELATGQRAVVVEDGGSPAVSADGRRLAFARTTGALADLWLQELPSGEARRLSTPRFAAIASPRFLPDGETLVFAAAALPTRPGQPRASGGGSSLIEWLGPRTAYAHGPAYGLWLVGLDGSPARQIGDPVLDDPAVRWPPDGRGALVLDATGLHRVEGDGGRLATVLPLGGTGGFDWLPRR